MTIERQPLLGDDSLQFFFLIGCIVPFRSDCRRCIRIELSIEYIYVGSRSIVTFQKWLALYPEGCEAWAEQRRTGYPRLIKVAVNNSGNTISTDDMIRRVFFNQDYKTDNKALYDALVSKLGGADNGGTRLWWDTGRNNF